MEIKLFHSLIVLKGLEIRNFRIKMWPVSCALIHKQNRDIITHHYSYVSSLS